MATPTTMKHGPSQQGRTPSAQHGAVATPPVSTPFSATHPHHTFSPHGPKSSPQQFKRSPATTMAGQSINSTGPVNFDSPSAAAALGALGLSGGLDLGLDHMGPGALGDLAPEEEDERVRRLREILAMLKKSKGRVSEAGLERLVKTTGLECLWEAGVGSDRSSKTLIIAGSALSIDIVISNNIVQQVTLAFPDSAEIVSKHVDQAGRILFEDLKLGPKESPLTKKLDRFALNLERLALLDKLSVIPGFNCHEAIAGIYESLERLFQFEVAKLRADPAFADRSQDYLETTVLCARNGRPGMHQRGRVGLTLDYWRERHLVYVPPSSSELHRHLEKTDRIWGIWIGCNPIPVMGYPPARISTEWIGPGIEKPPTTAEEMLLTSTNNTVLLDWLQPPNTVLPGDGDDAQKMMAVDGMGAAAFQRLPNVMFTAEFEPPLVMTLSDADQIYQMLQATPSYQTLATFDGLMFPVPHGSPPHDPTETRTIMRTREVKIWPRGEAQGGVEPPVVRHKNTLFIYKPVYGRTISSLTFTHPSQVVSLMPRFRQYALLSTLLEKSFGPTGGAGNSNDGGTQAASSAVGNTVTSKKAGTPAAEETIVTRTTTTIRDDYASFLAGPKGEAEHREKHGAGDRDTADAAAAAAESVSYSGQGKAGNTKDEDDPAAEGDKNRIDVTLTAHPVPRLQVNFHFRGKTATVVIDVQLDGMLHVVSENVLVGEGGGGENILLSDNEARRRRLQPQDLAKILQMCEDIDQWCEWIRSRLG